jgi:hypothetical protein
MVVLVKEIIDSSEHMFGVSEILIELDLFNDLLHEGGFV